MDHSNRKNENQTTTPGTIIKYSHSRFERPALFGGQPLPISRRTTQRAPIKHGYASSHARHGLWPHRRKRRLCAARFPLQFPRLVRRSLKLPPLRSRNGIGADHREKSRGPSHRRGDLFGKCRLMMQAWSNYLPEHHGNVEVFNFSEQGSNYTKKAPDFTKNL